MVTRRAVRLVAALVMLATAVAVATAAPTAERAEAHHINQWYEGIPEYSTILNCFSIIGGYAYTERGAAAWVSFESNPENAQPGVNESFDITVSVFGLGNACSGQRFIPGFSLPAGVTLDTTRPIRCFTSAEGRPYGEVTGAVDCPNRATNLSSGPSFPFPSGSYYYRSSDTANAQTWPLPSGVLWEYHFPVKASTTQSSTNLQGYVKMFDGNDSPLLTPSQGLFVFGNAQSPVVWYDQPSTLASELLPEEVFPGLGGIETAYGLYSVGFVNTQGTEGDFYMQLGASAGNYTMGSVFAGSTNPSDPDDGYQIAADWLSTDGFSPLTPGSTYHWQLVYDRADGADVFGADQTFTVPSKTTCNGLDVTVNLALGQQPTPGDDVILGTAASETIAAQAGNDTICAEGGNDTVLGGLGNDWIDGGTGTNTVSYANAPSGVQVSIATTAPQNTVGEGTDTLSRFANIVGSPFGDTLTGNASSNVLAGLVGNDQLRGGGGPDQIEGGAGGDTINGGDGTDTAAYRSASAGVTVSLARTSAQNTVGAGTDTLVAVERLIGSSKGDTLTGNRRANRLAGGAGNDTLSGGKGSDALLGESGRDTCNGGPGTDTRSSCEVGSGFP